MDIIRHFTIFDAREDFDFDHVGVVGCGAIGSRVARHLVELGVPNIHLYDFDHVESHNLANQAYFPEHVGLNKAVALKELLKKKDPTCTVEAHSSKFGAQSEPNHLMFLCIDTVSGRREIARSLGNQEQPNCFQIFDCRMASSYGNVVSFSPFQHVSYMLTLENASDDTPGEMTPCGSPISVGVTAELIASFAVWNFIHYCTNEENFEKRIDLYFNPFFISTSKVLACLKRA